jgi:hypothetical protein
MKRAALFGSLAVVVLFLSIVSAGSGDARKKGVSPTTEVSIDDKSFLVDESLTSDSTLLTRELAKRGVRPPESFVIPGVPRPRIPVFSKGLVESANPRSIQLPIPRGLTAEHTLRMSGDDQSVDIATGKLGSEGTSVSSRLAAEGWTPVSMEGNTRLPKMFQKIQGKEIAVVCLDEKEGSFLLLRKLER